MESSRQVSRGGPARLSRRALVGAGGLIAVAALGGGSIPWVLGAGRPSRSTSGHDAPTAGSPGPASAQAPASTGASSPSPAPGLTPQQRIGQLFMAGLSSGAGSAGLAQVNDAIGTYNAGNVVLYGTGWSSAATVQAAVAPLQALAAGANGGVKLFVSGNQEGGDPGTFQAFYGPGFSTIPSALAQAQGDPSALMQQAQVWGGELLQAGVNLDLAPVLDTVPPNMVASNDPIGHWDREYGTDPQTVSTYGVAFLRGIRAGGVAACAKHFPGLGRVTGNTDYTAQGIVDSQFSGANDPFLQPYKAAIAAGVDMVMVSLAIYPQVDSQEPAVFSAPIITGILRNALGFQGVVITDDVGAAAAVADRTPGERALGFLRAGGDMILTVDATLVAPMAAAVTQAMAADPNFAASVNASVDRILRLKAAYGLSSG
jgi:beta-N-acetylhexosaminidase